MDLLRIKFFKTTKRDDREGIMDTRFPVIKVCIAFKYILMIILLSFCIFIPINSSYAETSESTESVADLNAEEKPSQNSVDPSAKANESDNTTNTDTSANEPNTDTSVNETNKDTSVKDSDKKSEEVPPVKKTTQKIKKPSIKQDGLLEILEGDYKYQRIPGISVSKNRTEENIKEESVSIDIQESDIRESEIQGSDGSSLDEKNEKGLFGLNKKTSDRAVIIILVLIVIACIILFRVRSKGRSDDVLRRFPGV